MYTLRGRRDARAVSRLGVHPAKESNPMRLPFLSCLASLVIAVPLVAQGLSENPSPQPPPLKGEGEQDQYSSSAPPLRCGEGVGGRDFRSVAQDAPARWPQFRGPQGRPIAEGAKPLPVHFGPGKHVLWKTPLPLGYSSPCIWDDHIFLTGFDAKAQKLETLCLDRRSGAIRWRRTAPAEKIERVYKVNSPASATPATDGRRVYVSFGSYGLLCYDFEGKELWRRPLPMPRAGFGTATSPIVAGDL